MRKKLLNFPGELDLKIVSVFLVGFCFICPRVYALEGEDLEKARRHLVALEAAAPDAICAADWIDLLRRPQVKNDDLVIKRFLAGEELNIKDLRQSIEKALRSTHPEHKLPPEIEDQIAKDDSLISGNFQHALTDLVQRSHKSIADCRPDSLTALCWRLSMKALLNQYEAFNQVLHFKGLQKRMQMQQAQKIYNRLKVLIGTLFQDPQFPSRDLQWVRNLVNLNLQLILLMLREAEGPQENLYFEVGVLKTISNIWMCLMELDHDRHKPRLLQAALSMTNEVLSMSLRDVEQSIPSFASMTKENFVTSTNFRLIACEEMERFYHRQAVWEREDPEQQQEAVQKAADWRLITELWYAIKRKPDLFLDHSSFRMCIQLNLWLLAKEPPPQELVLPQEDPAVGGSHTDPKEPSPQELVLPQEKAVTDGNAHPSSSDKTKKKKKQKSPSGGAQGPGAPQAPPAIPAPAPTKTAPQSSPPRGTPSLLAAQEAEAEAQRQELNKEARAKKEEEREAKRTAYAARVAASAAAAAPDAPHNEPVPLVPMGGLKKREQETLRSIMTFGNVNYKEFLQLMYALRPLVKTEDHLAMVKIKAGGEMINIHKPHGNDERIDLTTVTAVRRLLQHLGYR